MDEAPHRFQRFGGRGPIHRHFEDVSMVAGQPGIVVDAQRGLLAGQPGAPWRGPPAQLRNVPLKLVAAARTCRPWIEPHRGGAAAGHPIVGAGRDRMLVRG